MRSDSPPLYALAVSNTRIPRSSARRTMRSLSWAGVRLPKFMVPSASAGGLPGVLFGIGVVVVVMVALFLPRTGLAHTLGLSVAELDVTPEGPVAAHITFASAEPLNGTPMRDEDLRSFLAQGVDVTADGTHCEGTFQGSSVTEADGLRLDAMYDCPAASHVEVTLYYLSALSPGHREVARIVASGASVEGLLTGERRALGLDIPGRVARPSAHARTGRRLVVLTAVFAVFMAGLFVWRWRATRRRRRTEPQSSK